MSKIVDNNFAFAVILLLAACVGFYFYNYDAKHLFFVTNQEHADLEEKNPGFVRWVTDWIEVKV